MVELANTNRKPKPDLRFTREDIALVVHAEFCQVLRAYGIPPERFRKDRALNRRAEATADFIQMAALDHFRPGVPSVLTWGDDMGLGEGDRPAPERGRQGSTILVLVLALVVVASAALWLSA